MAIDRIRDLRNPIRLPLWSILHRFRDKATYWSKIAIFHTGTRFSPGETVANIFALVCFHK